MAVAVYCQSRFGVCTYDDIHSAKECYRHCTNNADWGSETRFFSLQAMGSTLKLAGGESVGANKCVCDYACDLTEAKGNNTRAVYEISDQCIETGSPSYAPSSDPSYAPTAADDDDSGTARALLFEPETGDDDEW